MSPAPAYVTGIRRMTPELGWILATRRASRKTDARCRWLPASRAAPNGGRGSDLVILSGIWTHA